MISNRNDNNYKKNNDDDDTNQVLYTTTLLAEEQETNEIYIKEDKYGSRTIGVKEIHCLLTMTHGSIPDAFRALKLNKTSVLV